MTKYINDAESGDDTPSPAKPTSKQPGDVENPSLLNV